MGYGLVKGDIIDADYSPLPEKRDQIHYKGTRDIRISSGRFYTPEEWEERRKEVLSKELP